MKPKALIASVLWAAVLAGSALQAQSNIDPIDKFSWGENIGWMSWWDANGAADGVRVEPTFLGGFVWCEQVGWLNLGDGTPAGGTSYANVDGGDFGVNIAPDSTLSGFGWGEHVGWVNFYTPSLGAHRARFDATAGRFRGYAWGENVGWINLDDSTSFVGVDLPPPEFRRGDCNDDGSLNIADAVYNLSILFPPSSGGPPVPCLDACDANDDGAHNIADAVRQLTALFPGVGGPNPLPPPGSQNCGPDPIADALDCANHLSCP